MIGLLVGVFAPVGAGARGLLAAAVGGVIADLGVGGDDDVGGMNGAQVQGGRVVLLFLHNRSGVNVYGGKDRELLRHDKIFG